MRLTRKQIREICRYNENCPDDWNRQSKILGKFLKGKKSFLLSGKNLKTLYELGFPVGNLVFSLIPKDDAVRKAVLDSGIGQLIVNWAWAVDRGPKDDTRAAVIASNDPEAIADYSAEVERKPNNDIRQALIKLGNPKYLYRYIDMTREGSTDESRQAIINSGDVRIIIKYAIYIDRKRRSDTWAAVFKSGDRRAMDSYVRAFEDDEKWKAI